MNYKAPIFSPRMSSTKFTVILACAFMLLYNLAFLEALVRAIEYDTIKGWLFGLSIILIGGIVIALSLSLVVLPWIVKPAVIILLLTASLAAYFMNTYGIVIHHHMVQNTLETDIREMRSLYNKTLLAYFILLGIIPSVLVARTKLQFLSRKYELQRKLKLWAVGLITAIILIMCFSADYASFFRNEKHIRQLLNPINVIYASISYFSTPIKSSTILPIGEDAKLSDFGQTISKPTLLVVVVGETARADHFSINGYAKPTTPLLAQQNIINYHQVTSCGTETAVSVPCMFSNLGRDNYKDHIAKSQESLLDVVKHSGYSVFWRDNNSGCKGACARVAYEDMTHRQLPNLCNERECFDEVLLHDIDEKIDTMTGNKMIVLHQKGSHGPDYHHRYPADREIFTPVCRVNNLQDCSNEEINNAFDNSIHYTDYFLNSTIEWLKTQKNRYNTALIYVSDHGESLGEKNLYLHGMPYVIAPQEQKHVPFFLWFSEDFTQANEIDESCLRALTNVHYSHDNLFHTTLGLLNIETQAYNKDLDMVQGCRKL